VDLFRITYASYLALSSDVEDQMVRGGVLVRVDGVSTLAFDAPVDLEIVLPDGTARLQHAKVLQVLTGLGVAVTIEPTLVEELRKVAALGSGIGGKPTRYERVDTQAPPVERMRTVTATLPPFERPRATTPPPFEQPSNAQKIHMAMHGNRDERNAILRDKNRALHQYVLKNPGLGTDDVLEIAKSALTGPDMLRTIAERNEWFHRPQIALGIARNPKTPADIAVRALEFVPMDALRLMAKGAGVLPHVAQAARKKLIPS
jgi:hypothetical protein